MVTDKQVAKVIADIVRDDWKPNGHREEGYSIIVAKPGEVFCVDSSVVERLRLRLNTIDRLVNKDEHKVFGRWTVKRYPAGTEIRFIAKSEDDYSGNTDYRHPSVPDYEVDVKEGALSFAGWLIAMRYGDMELKHCSYDDEHYVSVRTMIGDLVDDWSSDLKSLYKDNQELYDYITRVGCHEAVDALNATVDSYRKYCTDNGLVADDIDKWGNQEEEEDE